jgi:rhodanese-related sulfurtransferase
MSLAEPTIYQCIPPLAAARLIRGEPELTLFDVRDLAAYRQGHVDGAAHLAEDRLMGWFRRLPKEQPVVIYCYKGNMSKTYAQMFSDFRFTRVFSVDGGYEALATALAESVA